ncbi:MAG: hypothetical protein JEZ00_04165 [Anaerolineaceae bacterium]|nr:hypothetical protein [Anaerolineaceae bacterium]
MAYTVKYSHEKDYIFVIINGEFSLLVFKRVAADVANIVAETDCKRILNDMRGAELTVNTFDIYSMPESAQQSGVSLFLRRALIVGKRASEFSFLETVFLNQGHMVKLFANYEEGEKWLFEDELAAGTKT